MLPRMARFSSSALLLALLAAALPAVAQPAPAAAPAMSPAEAASRAAVDRLLAAMGGREPWAKAGGYRVEAVHRVAGEPTPRESLIVVDFAQPRTRTESRAPGSLRITLLDGDRLQRRRDGDTSAPPPGVLLGEREWWRANLYRTLHRLAANDPALRAALTDRRLVVLDDGAPLLWITLRADGSPSAFGTDFGAPGTTFGPLRAFGDVRAPSTSTRDEGRWRAEITAFALTPAPPAELFARF